MLEFFRKYQKIFFIGVTFMVISSFVFFGTFSTFTADEERKVDRTLGKQIDGSDLLLSEVEKMAQFIDTDQTDAPQRRGELPNLCNDGVIRKDFIQGGLAPLFVSSYFDLLKGDFEARQEKAGKFRLYTHPSAPSLNAAKVWDYFFPDFSREFASLKEEKEISFATFERFEKMYRYQSHLQPEMLRQILIYQHQQDPSIPIDERLKYDDFALFGFHSASDWFGKNFVHLLSEFILNVALLAEEKGYRVTLEEAKGDLIHNFQRVMDQYEGKAKPQISFQGCLRSLGLEEKSGAEVWRKVLLFRKYFGDVGEAAFVDQLAFKDFAKYAKESALIQTYRWPIQLKTAHDLAQFQFYVKAIGKDGKELPQELFSLAEMGERVPGLVQKMVKAKVAAISKKELGLRFSLKEVWEWQLEDRNWIVLRNSFSLPKGIESTDKRFELLRGLQNRAQIDAWARGKMVDEHCDWIDEALMAAPLEERTWTQQANLEPTLKEEGVYFRLEEVEIVKGPYLLTFNEAKELLSKWIPKVEGELSGEKNPFTRASALARLALQKGPNTSETWVQSGTDPITDQFKLERSEKKMQRGSKEDWMQPDTWSPIDESGEFFFVQEWRTDPTPVIDRLMFGKEMLAADAKLYLTEKLIEMMNEKNTIVIPLQKEDE